MRYSYNKNKKKLNYMILIIMILVISIGYAVLSTNLNIVGAGTINNPTWNIHWENVQVKTGSVSASTPTIDTAKTTVNYSVTLTIPGDYYEFTVDAVNAGTIDGMVSVVSNKLNNTEITTLPNYLEYKVTYEDGVDIAPNHLLAANTSEKYKVHVGYKKDISATDIPTTPQTLNLSFSVTYVQRDTSAVPVPHPETVYTANIFDKNDDKRDDGTNTSLVWIGKSIPNGITTFQTPELAMASLKEASGGVDRPFFLKHTVSNNTVTDSYVGFVVTEEMAQANPGMTAGTYYLKGKKTYELVEENWQCMSEYDDGNGNCLDPNFNTNKELVLSAFGSSHCSEWNYGFRCNISGLYAYAGLSGYVTTFDDAWECYVDRNGYSGCSDY